MSPHIEELLRSIRLLSPSKLSCIASCPLQHSGLLMFKMNHTTNKPYLEETCGQPCNYYNNNTEKYFNWHKDFHLLNVPTK